MLEVVENRYQGHWKQFDTGSNLTHMMKFICLMLIVDTLNELDAGINPPSFESQF